MKLKVFIVSDAPPEVMQQIERAFQPLLDAAGATTRDLGTASCEGQMPSGFGGGGTPLDWTPPFPGNAQCSSPMQASPGPDLSQENRDLLMETLLLRAKLQAAEAEISCTNLRNANNRLMRENAKAKSARKGK